MTCSWITHGLWLAWSVWSSLEPHCDSFLFRWTRKLRIKVLETSKICSSAATCFRAEYIQFRYEIIAETLNKRHLTVAQDRTVPKLIYVISGSQRLPLHTKHILNTRFYFSTYLLPSIEPPSCQEGNQSRGFAWERVESNQASVG